MARLSQSATAIPDSAAISLSMWFRFPASTADGSYALLEFGDASGGSNSYIECDISGGSIVRCLAHFQAPAVFDPVFEEYNANSSIEASADVISLPLAAWHHLFISVNWQWTSAVDVIGPWPIWLFLDGVSRATYPGTPGLVNASSGGTGPPVPRTGSGILVSGAEVSVPRQSDNPNFWSDAHIELAEMQAWFGTFIDPSISGNLAKFIKISGTRGKPVGSSTAATAFGKQTLLFSGNKSKFIVNKGNGGAFVKVGTVTDFTPGPSF